MQVGYRDARRQLREVWVAHRHRGRCFCSEAIQLGGGHPVVQAFDDPHGYGHGIYERTQTIAKLLDAGRDFIKFDGFFAAIAL